MAAPERLTNRGLLRALHKIPEGRDLAVPAGLIMQIFGKALAERFAKPATATATPSAPTSICQERSMTADEETEFNEALAVLERLGSRRYG